MANTANMKKGIFYINDEPQYFVSGEYPYYRDHKDQWEDRLLKLKNAGIQVVTCNVPWRHHVLRVNKNSHQIKQEFDFCGKTLKNRDLLGFIQLIAKLGLKICLKLGPFYDQHLKFGGMPDYISPDKSPQIQPFRNHMIISKFRERSINRWPPITGQALPSPFDPIFKSLYKNFLSEIYTIILEKNAYPKGSIILIQFLNQGFYTSGNWGFPYAADYSVNNIQCYRSFLKNRYHQSITYYNARHHTQEQEFTSIIPPTLYKGNLAYREYQDFLTVIDWIDFRTERLCAWINEMQEIIQPAPKLPIIITWSPPCNFGIGLDVWYAWANIEKIHRLTNTQYGYSNWIAPISHKPANYARYGAVCSRFTGFNMEENWGFARVFDKNYKYTTTSMYQTLLACAFGSTGYNVNPGVGTSNSSNSNLIRKEKKSRNQFPSHPAISNRGKLSVKYYMMTGLNKFFGEYFGKNFLESKQDSIFSLGFYSPYAAMAALAGHDPKVWKRLKLQNGPVFGQDAFIEFYNSLRHMKMGIQITNLEEDLLTTEIDKEIIEPLLREKSLPKVLIFISTKILGRKVQEKLVNYVEMGGILCLFGDIPEMDEKFKPCSILNDSFPQISNETIVRSKCQNQRVCSISRNQGYLLYNHGNPLASPRGVLYYTLDFLIRTLIMPLRVRLPHKRVFHGKIIPYAIYQRLLGLDLFKPRLRHNSLKTFNLLLRFLQSKGIHRDVEITLRTDYIFRRKIEIFVYTHPINNEQFVFLFSKQTNWTLPVSIHLYYPDRKMSLRIQTKILGRTSQLLHISNGKLTGVIFTGINPISRVRKAMEIKINKNTYQTDKPIDIIVLTNKEKGEIYLGNSPYRHSIRLSGFTAESIKINPRQKYYLFDI